MVPRSSFVDYERRHNLFLQAMRGTALSAVLRKVAATHWAVLVPQSVRLEELGLGTVTERFVRAHTVLFDAPPDILGDVVCGLSTLDGLRGRLLTTSGVSGRRCRAVELELPAVPDISSPLGAAPAAPCQTLQVLREMEVEIEGPGRPLSVPIFLVHDAVRAGWCASTAAVGDPLLGGAFGAFAEPAQQDRRLTSADDDCLLQLPSGSPQRPCAAPPAAAAPDLQPVYRFRDFVDRIRRAEASALHKKVRCFCMEIAQAGMADSSVPERVHDFLGRIMRDVRRCALWQGASDLELDFAREGMEKYVMTKIYDITFGLPEERKRDEALSRRLSKFGFIEPAHFDLSPRILQQKPWDDACQELLRMEKFKNPRDKLISVSNACKLIFQAHSIIDPKRTMSADDFLPCLILLVLKANPPNLVSNCGFIQRYRAEDKMGSEQGYYLCNLQSVVYFWENADAGSLRIDQALFDRVSAELEDRGVEVLDFCQIDGDVTNLTDDTAESTDAGSRGESPKGGTPPRTSPPFSPLQTDAFAAAAAVDAARRLARAMAADAQRDAAVEEARQRAEAGTLRVGDLDGLHREWTRLSGLARRARRDLAGCGFT
eukprot:TRINITY_DN50286_c0_g1_i1.p1 TRINITY_DN50286_c0_g1~~TRINITY_DN50286_c0_g1_i1.p1  ORF type:complete len:625 (+),score=154.19 TRINITY_DN50286_c0_g1_i1:75-1877(+)